jgi:hypothetical protein
MGSSHVIRLFKGLQPAIYCLSDPDTGAIRYVGQSVDLYHRGRNYHTANVTNQPHLKNWLNKLKRDGKRCLVHVLALTDTREELNDAERHWIAYGKANGWKLVNATDGGDQAWTTKTEAVERMRQTLKAIWSDPARRDAATAKRMGLTVAQLHEHRAKKAADREARAERWRQNGKAIMAGMMKDIWTPERREKQRQTRLAIVAKKKAEALAKTSGKGSGTTD